MKKPKLAIYGINKARPIHVHTRHRDRGGAGTRGGHRPQRDPGLERDAPMCGHRAPSRCTRTCCRAARPTPWPPSPPSSSGSSQSLSAAQSAGGAGDDGDAGTSGERCTSAPRLPRVSSPAPPPRGGPARRSAVRLRVRDPARDSIGRVDGARELASRALRVPRAPLSFPGCWRGPGPQESASPQPRGRRRLLFPFVRRPDGGTFWEAPQF